MKVVRRHRNPPRHGDVDDRAAGEQQQAHEQRLHPDHPGAGLPGILAAVQTHGGIILPQVEFPASMKDCSWFQNMSLRSTKTSIILVLLALIAVETFFLFKKYSGETKLAARFEPPSYPSEPRLLRIVQNGKVGFIDAAGQIILEPVFTNAEGFAEGLCASATKVGSTYKIGFIDRNGKFVIKPQFGDVRYFTEGRAAVRLTETGQWGFIDLNGDMVIPPSFDCVGFFTEGVAKVGTRTLASRMGATGTSIECNYHYVDRWGNKVDPPAEGPPPSNLIHFLDENTKLYGYKDLNGNVVIQPRFEQCPKYFTHVLERVRINRLYGYINVKGDVVVAPQFQDAGDFSCEVAPVRTVDEGRWGYIYTLTAVS